MIKTSFLILLFAQIASARELSKDLEKAVRRIKLPTGEVSVLVSSLSGKDIFSINPEKILIPASLTKIPTSLAILNNFQPGTTFKTQLWHTGNIEKGTLKGDLILKGGGDPAFVSEKMWMLVNELRRWEIKKITGNLIVDDSVFDQELYAEGRESERNDRAYDSPTSGLSFNWNSINVFIRPGPTEGSPAAVFIDPENSFTQLVNRATTKGRGQSLRVSRDSTPTNDVITVNGQISIGHVEKVFYKSITQPSLFAGACLVDFLKQRGIEVQGTVKKGKQSDSDHLLVDFQGDPLEKLLRDLNKFSNNFVAEMLTKGLAYISNQKQGTMDEGLKIVRKFIEEQIGIKKSEYVLENVSGFTRKNQFSARQLVNMLLWARNHFRIGTEYFQSLPVSGVDGTLEKRMKSVTGQVRAKTGLLNGVVGLAGFAETLSEHEVYIFAFIYNGGKDETLIKSKFDELAESIVK